MAKTLAIDRPNERQVIFLEEHTHKYIAYGGARGGGKSWAVQTKAKLLAFRYPGIKMMIVRRTYNELQANHIKRLCGDLYVNSMDRNKKLASYNDSKKEIYFPNGSLLMFRYCENEKDADRYQGTEVDILFIDEATQLEEIIFNKLSACVRGVNSYPKRIYLTMNPGGPGHAWARRLFIDRNYNENEHPEDYIFFPAKVTDNIALMKSDPDYIHQLEALPKKLREAWLNGNWDIFEGQYFEDFIINPTAESIARTGLDAQTLRERHRWTHVIPNFEYLPDGWQVHRAFDWGYSKPFATVYFAVDFEGVAYAITEFYGYTGEANEGVKWDAGKVFREMKAFENDHPLLRGKVVDGVADPAIWKADGGESIAEIASVNGIEFFHGDNQRIPGWMQMHYRFAFDENGKARFYICEECRNLIRTLPLLQYDDVKCEDLDTEGEDHLADACRYFFMSRPVKAPIAQPKQIYRPNPLEVDRKNAYDYR